VLDYEAELAVVIGKPGRRIPQEQALEHVAGYSLFNDATMRDFQLRTPQWTMGKNFDGTGSFGPWLVTPDAVPPGAHGMRIQGRLNGRVMQDARTDLLVTHTVSDVENHKLLTSPTRQRPPRQRLRSSGQPGGHRDAMLDVPKKWKGWFRARNQGFGTHSA